MAKHLRIEFAGALYHVTARGDRREAIFESALPDSAPAGEVGPGNPRQGGRRGSGLASFFAKFREMGGG